MSLSCAWGDLGLHLRAHRAPRGLEAVEDGSGTSQADGPARRGRSAKPRSWLRPVVARGQAHRGAGTRARPMPCPPRRRARPPPPSMDGAGRSRPCTDLSRHSRAAAPGAGPGCSTGSSAPTSCPGYRRRSGTGSGLQQGLACLVSSSCERSTSERVAEPTAVGAPRPRALCVARSMRASPRHQAPRRAGPRRRSARRRAPRWTLARRAGPPRSSTGLGLGRWRSRRRPPVNTSQRADRPALYESLGLTHRARRRAPAGSARQRVLAFADTLGR